MQKYVNAKEVLPDTLLREIQKHISGQFIYVPEPGLRARWGTRTGTRDLIDARNRKILERRHEGASLVDLSREFHLSRDTIRRIVYCGKNRSNNSR